MIWTAMGDKGKAKPSQRVESYIYVDFFKRPTETLNTDNPPFYKWFPGGKFNACYNCVDVHVENGRGKDKALIYDSPVTGTSRTFTFKELQDEVAATAGMLRSLGVEAGIIMVIHRDVRKTETLTYQLCWRVLDWERSIHGFAAKELAVRIDDAEPKVSRGFAEMECMVVALGLGHDGN
eukprot:243031-Amorphochlora_amoeboformis.AAC.3